MPLETDIDCLCIVEEFNNTVCCASPQAFLGIWHHVMSSAGYHSSFTAKEREVRPSQIPYADSPSTYGLDRQASQERISDVSTLLTETIRVNIKLIKHQCKNICSSIS